MDDEQDLINEQIDYYRRAAAEWDNLTIPSVTFEEQDRAIKAAIEQFAPRGDVLEIACGPGQLTRRLLEHDVHITALDASKEMIKAHKARIASDRVRYIQADIFSWEPDRTYDVVAFGYWISHVPESRFESFWDSVRACLAPQGRVYFEDEMADAWRHEPFNERMLSTGPTTVVERTLGDGSQHRVIKVFWEPSELEDKLRRLGWDIEVHGVWPFMWGAGGRT